MNGNLSASARIVCVVLACTAPRYAFALDITLAAGYSAEYTNNTGLTDTDEQSEWIQTPQINFGLDHVGPSITATANYSVSRQIHQADTFTNQTNTVGASNITWQAIADRLSFNASNVSTLTTIDSQTQDVPTNQQITNTTTAGSTLSLDGPSNHTIDLHYEYAFSDAQRTDTDSRRQTGTVAYVVPLSPQRRIQLNGSLGRIDYDSSLYSDYTSKSAHLQFVNDGDSIKLDTQVGYTVFDRNEADDVSGMTGNIDIIWNLSTTTHITATAARSLQDQSQNVLEGIPEFGQTFRANTNITTPYTLDAYSLGIATQLGHNNITLTGTMDAQNYDGAQPGQTIQDQDTKGVILGIGRALRQTVHAQLYANYLDTDFHDGDRQKNYATGLRIDWNRWRNLSISTATAYQKQTSDVTANEYTEWTGTISFMYTLLGGGRR
jgi:hypothetical protein